MNLFKEFRYYIDNNFRKKVIPVKGSVLYTDLYSIAEHSGIYIGDNQISNIVVDGFAKATVEVSYPEDFTDSSTTYNKIYVSCDKNGAVGDSGVYEYAKDSIGESGFYGLLFSNCHSFSEECVRNANKVRGKTDILDIIFSFPEWEPSIRSLKRSAKKYINATKWLLWDWKNQSDESNELEPNIDDMINHLENMALNEKTIANLKDELLQIKEYKNEISDENIPNKIVNNLTRYQKMIEEVNKKYEESKEFLKLLGSDLSYNELSQMGNIDFTKLANEMILNKNIAKVIKKLGRNYITPKKKEKVSRFFKNEIHSIQKSDEISRLLPSELLTLEDEDLEYLFYAKVLEKNLLTYELKGDANSIENIKNKGPIVACLDTSSSMDGTPLLKARALLFAIYRILKKENRDMYILLFGSTNEIKELFVPSSKDLLYFLTQGFNGGTNFETPLKRSFEIIEQNSNMQNADILMITDGLCQLSSDFKETLKLKKNLLGFEIYTIICQSSIIEDDYSTEIINI